MGKTYQKNSRRFDDEVPSGRSGNHNKHTNGKKTGGMRTLNSYVEEEYDDNILDLQDELMYNDTSTNTKNKP